jgi:hypothetical protein
MLGRRRRNDFYRAWRRWADADDDLSARDRCGKRERGCGEEELLSDFHGCFSLGNVSQCFSLRRQLATESCGGFS